MTYRDPLCTIRRPGHQCRRRDGQLLTGTNGDCDATARLANAQPREHAVACQYLGCPAMTWATDAICHRHKVAA